MTTTYIHINTVSRKAYNSYTAARTEQQYSELPYGTVITVPYVECASAHSEHPNKIWVFNGIVYDSYTAARTEQQYTDPYGSIKELELVD